MGSVRINGIRAEFPGRSDAEVAAAFAAKYGYLVIVRYKRRAGGDYDHFGCCVTGEEVAGYLRSSSCHDVEIVCDRRTRRFE